MTLIYIAAFGCLALSIPVAIWIKKHLSTSTKLIGLPVFLIIANEVKFTSQNFPDWLNIILVFIFSVVCGGVMVYIGCEVLNIWSKISPTETNALNNKNNESDYENREYKELLESIDKEHRIEAIQDKIDDLKWRRSQIVTHNGWGADKLSPSELERNWKKDEYLAKQIEDLYEQLWELKNK